LEKIKTYLVITDETNLYGSSIGLPIQSYVYEVDQFDELELLSTKFNIPSLERKEKNLRLCIISEIFYKIQNIIDLYLDEKKRKLDFTVVKYWENVNQEFSFSNTKLINREDDFFTFNFDSVFISEKSETYKKWSGNLIPFIRDQKINDILHGI
jgi:hypothetical protein